MYIYTCMYIYTNTWNQVDSRTCILPLHCSATRPLNTPTGVAVCCGVMRCDVVRCSVLWCAAGC